MAEFMFQNVVFRATVYRTGVYKVENVNEGDRWSIKKTKSCQRNLWTTPNKESNVVWPKKVFLDRLKHNHWNENDLSISWQYLEKIAMVRC